MKIGIINLSGNVGKSTFAIHGLAAFNPGAKIVSVESINSSATDSVSSVESEQFSASEFREIFREIMMHDDVIVDVGSSNVERFMTELTRFKSAVGEFDMIVVPTVPADKQQRDTIATIEWLHRLGVDGKKIRVVFNQYGTSDLGHVQDVYAQLVGYLLTEGRGKAVAEPHVVVEHSEVFEMVKNSGKTIKQLAEDRTDWREARAVAKKAGDMEALEAAMDSQMAHDLAVTAQENLALAHSRLLGAPVAKSKAASK